MVAVSIIIPMYNNEATIARALASCSAQAFTDFEVLVIDNGSQDQGAAVVTKLAASDPRIQLLHSPKGRSRARNTGLQAAQGQYLQFLDADDELLPHKLATAMADFDQDPSLNAVVMPTRYVDDKRHTAKIIAPAWRDDQQLLDANVLPISAVTFRNQAIVGFEEALEFNEDWQFWALNLYGKPIKFESKAGDIINVGDSTTMMQHFDEMRLSEVKVRAQIKRRFPVHSKRLLRRDLRLASTYLILHPKYPQVALSVQSLRWQIIMMRIAFLIPKIKHHFEQLEAQTKTRSLYA